MDSVKFIVYLALRSTLIATCLAFDQSNRNHGNWISNFQESTGPMAPRITYNSNSLVTVRQATRAKLCCVAQAYPIPQFSWFKEDSNGINNPIQSTDEIEIKDGCLIIYSTSLVDHGRYTCIVSNVAGSEKATITLNVEVPLTVTVTPSSVTTDLGKSVAFVCSVTSSRPETRIMWLKDGRSLSLENSPGEIHFYNRSLKISTLNVASVVRDSAGTYQCFASNDYESSSSSSTLKLGDISPIIVQPLPSEIVSQPGSTVSLKCITTGSPLPEVTWSLDEVELMASSSSSGKKVKPSSSSSSSSSSSVLSSLPSNNDNLRYSIGDYVSNDGVLYSYLNVTSLEVIDGGQYKCKAVNDIGSAVSSTTLYIPGSPTPRYKSTVNLTLVAGRDALIRCPVIGYPIDFVRWQHREQSLPINHRQKIERLSTKDYRSALLIQNAQKYHDEGEYTCLTKGNDNKIVKGKIHLTIKVAPLIDSQPLPGTIYANEGIRVKLVCSIIEGDQPVEIRWLKSGQPLRPLSNILLQSSDDYSLLTFKKITFEDRGNYTCLASNSIDSSTRTTSLIVNVPPKWIIEPSNETTVVSGHRLIINCSSHGFPPPRISWKRSISISINGNTNRQNAANNNNTIGSTDLIHHYNHYHQYSNNNNVKTIYNISNSNNYHVVDKKTGNDTLHNGNDGKVNNGDTNSNNNSDNGHDKSNGNRKTIVTSISESHPFDFKDIFSSYRHHVYSNGTLVIQEVDKFDAGFYMCQVNNDIGAGLSKVVKLKVLMPPHFETKFISTASKKDDKTILKCEASGDLPMTIVWQKDKQPINFNLEKRFTLIEKTVESREGVLSLMEIHPTTRQDSALFTCQATNSLGTDDTNIQLIVMEKPEMPMILSVSDETSRSALVRWKGSFSGNSPILNYIVEYKVDGSEKDWIEVKTIKPDVELLLTGLTPVTLYKVRVRAVNAMGVSEPSPVAGFKTGEEVPGGPPRNVQLEASGAQSLKVKWFPPKKELLFGRIKGYYIGYRIVDTSDSYNYKNVEIDGEIVSNNGIDGKVGRSTDTDVNSDSSELSTYITNLKRRTTYEVIVQAYNSVGTGPRSDEVRMTTLQNSPPTTPYLKFLSSTFDSITIGWTMDDINVDPMKRDFVLYYKPENSHDYMKKEIKQLTVSEYTITGCKCGTKYAIYLIAKNSLGIGEPSKTITVRTKGGAPVSPTSIRHFTLINSIWVQINLGKWLDSGCPITKFIIKYKALANKQWIYLNKSTPLGTKVVTLNSLFPGKQYNLSISASSDAGTTEAEYTFSTLNYSTSSPNSSGGPIKNDVLSQASTSSTVIFKQYVTILLPVIISIFMLLTLLSIILFCLRHQNFFDGNTTIMEQSNFDRISCASAGGFNKSCGDLNSVEGVPMSNYSSITKFKSVDEPNQSGSISYYSSPNRKAPLINSGQTSIPIKMKSLGGVNNVNDCLNMNTATSNNGHSGSNHDYSEPFVQFCGSQRLSTPCLSDICDSHLNTLHDDSHLKAQYASIKKKQMIRPSSLFTQYEDKI
ncbi:Down syndrome cell adhesion molecule-like protein 1 homolog [Tetranychus urticae]|uniref:MDscam8 n=1 Tax=Tetranychus urticae TaxID=32264 RepID=T1KEV2_TETUR|nr:Down syndrome cell adhesion molecule-like protein 1 homolog [Tetranychus urticae]AWV54576.1 mDscam8 [Tetranychus urticae]